MQSGQQQLVSIGEICRETGLSPHTIRVWERRYGRPKPQRLPSGHRRFTQDQVRWLRQVSEALSLGLRPGRVLRLPEAELEELLASKRSQEEEREEVQELLAYAQGFERAALEHALQAFRSEHGARACLFELVAPLVRAAGAAWVEGSMNIRHEHFLTEVLEGFMRSLRDSFGAPGRSEEVVLATLEGERHALGLQMAALVFAAHGIGVRVLGTSLPLHEIAASAAEKRTAAVGVSVSLCTSGPESDRALAQLRVMLPSAATLLAGGEGVRRVRRGPRGIVYLRELGDLERWLRKEWGAQPTASWGE